MRTFLFLIFVVSVFAGCYVPSNISDNNPQNTVVSTVAVPDDLPEFEIVSKELGETKAFNQVRLHVLIDTAISESQLTTLLEYLYDKEKATRQFQYWGGYPTKVIIRAYHTRENALVGNGWIGMLFQPRPEDPIKIDIHRERFEFMNAPDELRFGLSEEERIDIFQDLVRIGRRATAEADELVPIDGPHSEIYNPNWTDTQKRKLIERNNEQMEKLKKQYEVEYAEELGLSLEQFRKIFVEAVEKGWPYPR